MRNIKLTLQYNGTNYHGSQIQPKAQTVQGVLEFALYRLYKTKVQSHFAGRTDSGVHAYGQVVNYYDAAIIPIGNIPQALNNLLPMDICVQSAEEVPLDFHARFSKSRKTYLYKILVSSVPNVFAKDLYYHLKTSLNVDHMKKAVNFFIGVHDFKSFVTSGRSPLTTEREI